MTLVEVEKRIDHLLAIGTKRLSDAADPVMGALNPWPDRWLEADEFAELETLRMLWSDMTREERSPAAARERVRLKRAARLRAA